MRVLSVDLVPLLARRSLCALSRARSDALRHRTPLLALKPAQLPTFPLTVSRACRTQTRALPGKKQLTHALIGWSQASNSRVRSAVLHVMSKQRAT
eukprot:5055173-Pleurochrysis_carterae.AAC.1